MPDETPKTYGVFISHASEDKAEVARPLAQELERLGVKVWLDEFELTLGDSLRQEIDRGLTQSHFGVVILSPDFFRKEWPQRELNALVAIEGDGKVILPVWHHLTKEQIIRYSPLLAGKLAVSTDQGISYVANEILRAIKHDRGEELVHEQADHYRIKKLANMRGRLIVASSVQEITQLKYEIEAHLTSYPTDVEAQILRDDITRARKHEMAGRERSNLDIPEFLRRREGAPSSYLPWVIVLFILLTVVVLYIALNWR
ncbi:MAG: toll/interleukin-1 receptor domain-containing protein [Chloroflexi bacterium]|nr:toll/interleukin-1 receptor domain-containing protein [Chloroflexota bacterium]